MGGGGGYGIRGHFGSRDSSDSSPSTHRAATAMASVSVPLRIQGASMLAEAPKVGPAMLLTCEFVMPLGDLVNAMAKYQMQHEAAPAACAEPRSAPSAVLNPKAPAFPKPEPKPEVAESVALEMVPEDRQRELLRCEALRIWMLSLAQVQGRQRQPLRQRGASQAGRQASRGVTASTWEMLALSHGP